MEAARAGGVPGPAAALRAEDFWQDIDDLAIKTNLLGCTIQLRGSKRTKTGVEVSFQGKVEGPNPAQPTAPSVEDRLGRLKNLLDAGLITDAEYETRKAQIVSEL